MLKVVLPKQPRTLKVCRIKFPAELEERRSKLRRTATPPTRRRRIQKRPFSLLAKLCAKVVVVASLGSRKVLMLLLLQNPPSISRPFPISEMASILVLSNLLKRVYRVSSKDTIWPTTELSLVTRLHRGSIFTEGLPI